MNIRIIRHEGNLTEVCARGNNILEIAENSLGDRNGYELMLYDPEKNSVKEIAPDIKILDSIPVFNCIWRSSYVYFASYKGSGTSERYLDIFRYDPESDTCSIILELNSDDHEKSKNRSVKIFIISDIYIIVQTEQKRDSNIEMLMGNIEFVQTLYNLENGESVIISDLNLINNGINSIQPVSETHILLKTGFSYLEDSRINKDDEKTALIESVYFSSNSMFISSISRDNTTAGYKLLGTAYFDKCIVSPKISGDYIFFTILDHGKMSAETVFYNYVTDETIRCVSEDAIIDDLSNAYVINNVPYIRNTYSDRTEFFNVKTSESDCIFFDEDFADITGGLFIFEEHKAGRSRVRIYRYPRLNLIAEENGEYLCSVSDNDNCCIYITD